ncbi:MAG TPA: glycosyltransferase family 2 protein [Luteolibacter sp.]|nr:glycosyltransferase family 2 protein [Luteolibacter sp.]
MSKPVVSVVVPAFNARLWIAATLESALSQTLKEIEVIVVDDGSTDDTAGVVESFSRIDPRVRLIRTQNAGVGAARNTAIKASFGEFIAPLDADDLWDPPKLEKQVNRMREWGDKAGLVYCWSRLIDEDGKWIMGGSSFEVEGGARKAIIFRNFVGNASVPLFRKEALDEVGLYLSRDEQGGVQGCEDWDLVIRLAEKWEIALVPEFLVGYRQTRGCMSAGIEGMTSSFRVLQQRARERNRDIPAKLFRWSGGRFLGYLVLKSYQGCDYRGCLMSIVRSFLQDPFMLLNRRFHRLAFKSLVLNATGLRKHPRPAIQWTQVKPPAGPEVKPLIQRIHDSRWRKTLAECGIPYTSGKSSPFDRNSNTPS